jgi:hypothetical protein
MLGIVIPSGARNPALLWADQPTKIRARFLAEFTLGTQSEIPSLRSGQALRFAQDDSEGLGKTGTFKALVSLR